MSPRTLSSAGAIPAYIQEATDCLVRQTRGGPLSLRRVSARQRPNELSDRTGEKRYLLIVTSAGRTGTKYFGERLGEFIPDAYSVHEPDVLMNLSPQSLRKIQTFGIYQTVVGKLLRRTGIRNLSIRYLSGQSSLEEMTDAIREHRARYYQSLGREFIIEAYSGWFGVLPAVPTLGWNYKILILVRDPYSWVRSNMNWGTMYGYRDWIGKLGIGRLTPSVIDDEVHASDWENYSTFQKLCWAWLKINEVLINYAGMDPNCLVVRFEDLFEKDDKQESLRRVVEWSTQFDDKSFDFKVSPDVAARPANVNISDAFPSSEYWDDQLKEELQRICGPMMLRLGYGER